MESTRTMAIKIEVMRKIRRGKRYFGRWPAYQIRVDQYGHWLYSPKGTVYHGHPYESEIVEWEVGRGPHDKEGKPELHLIPFSGWWVANWGVTKNGLKQICVDISTPATKRNNDWSFIDLELDPIWREDGYMEVLDEEEFQTAIDSGYINPKEAETARLTSTEIMKSLCSKNEPFGDYGWECWNEAVISGLPPIVTLSKIDWLT
jgi:hypothetical protein